MRRTASPLQTRSDEVRLTSWKGGDVVWERLLQAEAGGSDWRLVEVYSFDRLPFDAWLIWSSGDGEGVRVRITVARATRVCLFARSLEVKVTNLHTTENRVSCNVADPGGFVQTSNQLDVGLALGAAEVELEIPRFARSARVEVADPAQLSSLALSLYDGQNTLRASLAGDAQPPEGIALGGAHRFTVSNPTPVNGRVVYHLSL